MLGEQRPSATLNLSIAAAMHVGIGQMGRDQKAKLCDLKASRQFKLHFCAAQPCGKAKLAVLDAGLEEEKRAKHQENHSETVLTYFANCVFSPKLQLLASQAILLSNRLLSYTRL